MGICCLLKPFLMFLIHHIIHSILVLIPLLQNLFLNLFNVLFIFGLVVFLVNDTLKNHETGYLTLSSAKANRMLNWYPCLSFNDTVDLTIGWYKDYFNNLASPYDLCLSNIRQFISLLNEQ